MEELVIQGFGGRKLFSPLAAFRRYIERDSARNVFKKMQEIHLERPLISFTFDDFPRSALIAGGEILKSFGSAGTYYASLGLLGGGSPSGQIFDLDDLKRTLGDGHELGCHTYSHCNAWETGTKEFEESIVQNGAALSRLIPGAEFKSLSYPISHPRPFTKRVVSKRFLCSRGGGQKLNAGRTDLNQLSAFFLEKVNGNIGPVKELIDLNNKVRGWIIFATHDVSREHGPYGCTPEFFKEVVEYSVKSGARVLPVVKALKVIQSEEPGN